MVETHAVLAPMSVSPPRPRGRHAAGRGDDGRSAVAARDEGAEPAAVGGPVKPPSEAGGSAPQRRARANAGIRSTGRAAALNIIGAGVAAVLGAAFTAGTTRSFTQEEAGIFAAASSVFAIAYTVSRLGTGTGAVYQLSRYRATGRVDRLRASLRVATLPVLVVSTVVGGLLFALAPFLAARLGRGDDLVVPLRVLAVFIPLAAVSDLCLASARGLGATLPLVVVEKISRPLAQVVLLTAVVLLGTRPSVGLPAAWVLPYLPAAVVAWIWLTRLRRSVERRHGVTDPVPVDREEVRAFWSYTAPRALGSVVQIALQRLDMVLLLALRGPADAAVYLAATRFLVFGQLGGQALSTAVQHRFGELLATDRRREASRLYGTATAWLILTTWPAYLLFAVAAPFVLAVFGKGYQVGEPAMLVLAGAMLVATACGTVDNVLNMAGRTTWTLGNAILALVVNIVVDLLLIPDLGVLGAAIGWACAIVTNNVVPLVQLAVAERLHPFGPGMVLAAGTSLLWFLVLPGGACLLLDRSLPVLTAAALLGAAGFAATSWGFRRALELEPLLGAYRRRR